MKKIAVLILGLLLVPADAPQVQAADAPVTRVERPRARQVRHVERYRHHRVGCPDGYSCYPLYGAYGPYGGRAYWAAYVGW